MNIPVYIICRDRLTCLKELVTWLEQTEGVSAIIMVDNASTYPPLLEYYARTPHKVIRLPDNRATWGGWSAVEPYITTPYFGFTDCDVIPHSGCPNDLIPFLCRVLDQNALFRGAMAGFHLTDVPTDTEYGRRVHENEDKFWANDRYLGGGVFLAPVDTPLTVYRHGVQLCMQRDESLVGMEGGMRVIHPPWRMVPHGPRLARLEVFPVGGGTEPAHDLVFPLPDGVDVSEWSNDVALNWMESMVKGRTVRSSWPYVMHHPDWYRTGPLDAETQYYLDHACDGYAGWLRMYREFQQTGSIAR